METTDFEGAKKRSRFSQLGMSLWSEKEVLLGVRREVISDPESTDRMPSNVQQLKNHVTVTEPARSGVFVTMTLSGRDVIGRIRADARVVVGQSFDFAIKMEKAVAFDPEREMRIIV